MRTEAVSHCHKHTSRAPPHPHLTGLPGRHTAPLRVGDRPGCLQEPAWPTLPFFSGGGGLSPVLQGRASSANGDPAAQPPVLLSPPRISW